MPGKRSGLVAKNGKLVQRKATRQETTEAQLLVIANLADSADRRAKRNEALLHAVMDAIIAQGIDPDYLTQACAKRGIKFSIADAAPEGETKKEGEDGSKDEG
jgi:DNA-binding LacI/PurR family transcriptional regulator